MRLFFSLVFFGFYYRVGCRVSGLFSRVGDFIFKVFVGRVCGLEVVFFSEVFRFVFFRCLIGFLFGIILGEV